MLYIYDQSKVNLLTSAATSPAAAAAPRCLFSAPSSSVTSSPLSRSTRLSPPLGLLPQNFIYCQLTE